MKKLFILGLLALSVSGLQVVSACGEIVDGDRAVTLSVGVDADGNPVSETGTGD